MKISSTVPALITLIYDPLNVKNCYKIIINLNIANPFSFLIS